MKKLYLFILVPIILGGIYISRYEKDDIKTYKELEKIDSAIIAEVNHSDHSLVSIISSLQQAFEELIEVGITFTDDQDISQNLNQFNLALEKSNDLVNRLNNLFALDSIIQLSKIDYQTPNPLVDILSQENMRIKQLESLTKTLSQTNAQLSSMDSIFYSKRNNEVFEYIETLRHSFNQIQEEYIQYSQCVTEYMKQKSNLYSQINS